jgi:hypothetical protein
MHELSEEQGAVMRKYKRALYEKILEHPLQKYRNLSGIKVKKRPLLLLIQFKKQLRSGKFCGE